MTDAHADVYESLVEIQLGPISKKHQRSSRLHCPIWLTSPRGHNLLAHSRRRWRPCSLGNLEDPVRNMRSQSCLAFPIGMKRKIRPKLLIYLSRRTRLYSCLQQPDDDCNAMKYCLLVYLYKLLLQQIGKVNHQKPKPEEKSSFARHTDAPVRRMLLSWEHQADGWKCYRPEGMQQTGLCQHLPLGCKL